MQNTSQEEIHTMGISDPWEKCCDRALQTAHIPRAYKTSSINRTCNPTRCEEIYTCDLCYVSY